MSEKLKKILGIAVVIAVVGAVSAWMILNPGPEHIEDTNGADDYSLQTITEEDVVKCEMGTRGGLTETRSNLSAGGIEISDGIEYSCNKFTGVYRLYTCTVLKGSSIYVDLVDFQIRSGNFAFYVVLDGKIVGEVKPAKDGGYTEFTLDNVEKTGTLEYIIAGESANFSFISTTEW